MNIHLKTVSAVFVACLLLCIVTVTASASSAAGIKQKLEALTEVYTDGTYFTSDGEECTKSDDDRCDIRNIPARGEDLPAGSEVAACENQGYSYSCRAFANYVWYYIFGCHYQNSANTSSKSSPALGDYIKFNLGNYKDVHTAIYLWEDSDYYYVYDANGESDCEVHFDKKFSKSKWTVGSVYHAYNYDEKTDGAEPQFTVPDTSIYRLSNVYTGNILCSGFKLNKLSDVSKEESKLALTVGTDGFTIASEKVPGTYLFLTSAGKLTTSKKVTAASSWKILVIGDKFFIHNAKYPDYVLYDDAGTLKAGKYTGTACQVWTLDHLNHNYIAEVIEAPTCTETGLTKYACACGKEYFEYTVATGHTYKAKTVKATASVCGFTKNTCTVCGAIMRDNFTARTGQEDVNTETVKIIGDTVLVNPAVSEEKLLDLFPDFTSDNKAGLKVTGSHITSSVEKRDYYVIVAGDSDGDGTITVSDARYALRTAIDLDEPSEYGETASDWTSDGTLDTTDARLELRLALELESSDTLFENIYTELL